MFAFLLVLLEKHVCFKIFVSNFFNKSVNVLILFISFCAMFNLVVGSEYSILGST